MWLAEAAHLPVIWATQVLEGLAKSGKPSRAEIMDAVMGERAEYVMLNKEPHIIVPFKCWIIYCSACKDISKRKVYCCGDCTGSNHHHYWSQYAARVHKQ